MPGLAFMQDLASGSLSGVSSCLSGYFLDTVKVRMQVNSNLTMMNALLDIFRQQKISQIFSGIYYPLMTIPVINAITFSSYKLYKSIRGKQDLSALHGLQNGAFAGLMVTLIVAPVELIKCRMQTDIEAKFINSHQCMKDILKNKGIRGLFKGIVPTAGREIPSYATQFATYEFLKEKFVTRQRPHLKLTEAIFVGSTAALLGEMVSYPMDVIKTKIQISKAGQYTSHRYLHDQGMFACARSTIQKEGLKGFFAGVKPCMLRATFADGLAIVVYEKCHEALSKRYDVSTI